METIYTKKIDNQNRIYINQAVQRSLNVSKEDKFKILVDKENKEIKLRKENK